jgi:hypothetical protein
MKLTATKRLGRYGGKVLKAGDVFDAKPADARILLAINRATPYVEPPKPRLAIPVYKDMQAEASELDKPKRSYLRRDMTAKDK